MPEDARSSKCVGQQWDWSYRFPGKDGELGATDIKLVTVDNPFGMDPERSEGPGRCAGRIRSCTCRSTSR